MDINGVHYSTALSQVENVVVSLFDKGITSCQSVPQVEKVSENWNSFILVTHNFFSYISALIRLSCEIYIY